MEYTFWRHFVISNGFQRPKINKTLHKNVRIGFVNTPVFLLKFILNPFLKTWNPRKSQQKPLKNYNFALNLQTRFSFLTMIRIQPSFYTAFYAHFMTDSILPIWRYELFIQNYHFKFEAINLVTEKIGQMRSCCSELNDHPKGYEESCWVGCNIV